MSLTTENTFEIALVQSLVENGGYIQGNAEDYSPELGLFKYEVIAFLQQSQPKKWDKITAIHGADTHNRVINRLCKEMDLRGSLDVLRKGFVDYGVRFQMAFFKPASGLNPDAVDLYNKNSLKVYRQIYYSNKNKNSVDVVLALNGIPVATLELKNQFTGQNVGNALKQYSTTRDNRELLFAFKKRALVHFAVDQDEVFMCTKLEGHKTFWLPFNKGDNNGRGNPKNPNGYRTAYLWEDIFVKDSWMEILQRFVHLQTEEIETNGKTYKKEKLIFPRYHQLDVVRKITGDVYSAGAGKNYLVQHSAGSGKSNSIAWLAYRLSGLHNQENKRVFDSVIVITDRRVLDKQLQDTIYQFEHKQGVVQKIDKDSTQLANALGQGTNIIITTLQKFPFVIDKVGELPDRKYAVLIDEAHSSQGGEASKKMKEVLTTKDLAMAAEEEATYGDADYSGEDMVREQVEKSAAARGQQDNISFFAFTATPKYKTLQVFGVKGKDGKPKPFHLYSMRQAIEEGFILDVLQNYTTYELYFKLTKAIEDDPELNKKKASKAIGKYVSLHPHNLAQKTEIIIEHFRNIVAKKIGGKAKAMVVCGSRLHAKRYFEEFEKYIKAKGYNEEIKILVAFSGKVIDDNSPEGVSEPELTGFSEKELPTAFEKDEYKILIVANKYQTGFDQPLLHTMYVDKKLSGVLAVQTLSRLNRTCPGKEDTFVLDFANDRQTILDSFQPYYEITTVSDEVDVNHLYDLKARLDEFQVYWEQEIESFVQVYFNPNTKLNTPKQQKYLYQFTDPAVDRFKGLEEEKQDEFKKGLRTWTNLYAFLAQIMPFVDTDFERFFAYAKLLQTRLPKRELSESLHLDDEVALEYYRLQKIKDGAIGLQKDEDGELSGTSEAGLKKPKEEDARLSEIINVLNDRFGTEFEEADKLFFDQIEAELMEDETLQAQAKVNKMDTFKFAFNDKFIDKLIGRMDQNQEIFEKILEDESFGDLVKEWMMMKIYKRLNG
ncbi:type I restriction endonuclease subunit R [Sinomicrobium weinanense]|uniref:Type I restriction endonuclease subunit R n=1 Tax=Sinomicrobium weinanense TaxID=2842200 RepID=A0A926JVC1_9FLAO|nr:type I restriction endonuclease [Sinomicrobium weinanense]MBC9798242.1 type I restriction endonuclease subunit R [Sinomicrobium weinanense]MBU3123254.1 DEAD/DEAH box helicase family protein [Sinomicrobium weinanense]